MTVGLISDHANTFERGSGFGLFSGSELTLQADFFTMTSGFLYDLGALQENWVKKNFDVTDKEVQMVKRKVSAFNARKCCLIEALGTSSDCR